MSRSDFEARLARLKKPPATGTQRAVDKAMLDQKIHEMRAERDDPYARRDDDDIGGFHDWMSYLTILGYMLLAADFSIDPEAAKRRAIIIVPLVGLFTIILAYRAWQRRRSMEELWDFGETIEWIAQLTRFFR